jgi:hypothetical protein
MALQFDGIQHLLTNFFEASLTNSDFRHRTPSITRSIPEKQSERLLRRH